MNNDSLHPDLAAEIEGSAARAALPYAEKIAGVLFKDKKDVSAQIKLTEGANVPLLASVAHFAMVEASSRALLVAPDDASIGPLVDGLASVSGSRVKVSVCASDDLDPSARVVVGTPEALLAAHEGGRIRLRDFGFVALSDCDRIADAHPSDLLRHLKGLLLPAWERRTLAAASRMHVKATNLALEYCDEPEELLVEETSAKARMIAQEAYHVAADEKIKLLLGALRGSDVTAIVFCNLKSTAEELGLRLLENGIKLDYVLGNMSDDRKFHLGEQLRSGEIRILVVTDEGAEGLGERLAPLLVNYDIPLEGAIYLKRYSYLDDSDESARILNMVCERYVYGLPAVEKVIDTKIEAVRADPSMFADDASASMTFDRPKGKFGRGPGRLIAPGERGRRFRDDDAPRDERPRRDGGDKRRGRYERDDDDAGQRDAIRKRISDATGGSLDMDALGDERPPRAETGRDDSRRRDGRRDDQRRDDRGRRKPARNEPGKPRRDREGGRDQERRQERPVIADPYAISSEERMRLYKEKYGKRSARAEEPSGRPRDAQRQEAKPGRDQAGKAEGTRRDDARRSDARRKPVPKAQDRPQAGKPQAAKPTAPRRDAPKAAAPSGGKKKKDGLISSFFKLIAGRRD
jgi:ATP-dependent RNA helicase RhlB